VRLPGLGQQKLSGYLYCLQQFGFSQLRSGIFPVSLLQELVQQIHRQAYHIGFAALQDLDPLETILEAKAARFALPLASCQIVLDLFVPEQVHLQGCLGYCCPSSVTGAMPEADAGEHGMALAAHQPQHAAGIVLVEGFSKQLLLATGDSVTANHEPVADPRGNVSGLAQGQLLNELVERPIKAEVGFRSRIRMDYLKMITGGSHQLLSARRLAGQNQSRVVFK